MVNEGSFTGGYTFGGTGYRPSYRAPPDQVVIYDANNLTRVGIKVANYKGVMTTFKIGMNVIIKNNSTHDSFRFIDREGRDRIVNQPRKGTIGVIKRIAATGSLGIQIPGFEGNDLHGVLKHMNGAYVKPYNIDLYHGEFIIDDSDDLFDDLRNVL